MQRQCGSICFYSSALSPDSDLRPSPLCSPLIEFISSLLLTSARILPTSKRSSYFEQLPTNKGFSVCCLCAPEGAHIISEKLEDKVYQRYGLITFTTGRGGGGRWRSSESEGREQQDSFPLFSERSHLISGRDPDTDSPHLLKYWIYWFKYLVKVHSHLVRSRILIPAPPSVLPAVS